MCVELAGAPAERVSKPPDWLRNALVVLNVIVTCDDNGALQAFYAPGAAPPTPAAPPVPPPQATVVMIRGKRHVIPPPAVPPRDPISFDNLSVMTWSDAKETMVVTFNEHGTRSHRETSLRQYWERDASKWKIVAEGTVR